MEISQLPEIPTVLQVIPSSPKQLFHAGAPLEEILKLPRIAIVGSRAVSPYGQQVTERLASELAQQGIVIVSGLALGVDGIAHRAALGAAGLTIAVLPSSLEKIQPAAHAALAKSIVAHGGALVSEYPEGTRSLKQNFIARNRLVAGLADAVLITEAAAGSGSLHTARFAYKQGKLVLAVPGNITSPGSMGANELIKAGASMVTTAADVLACLGLRPHRTTVRAAKGRTPDEQLLIDLLLGGQHDGQELLLASGFEVSHFNQLVSLLEIQGLVRPLGNNQWGIR